MASNQQQYNPGSDSHQLKCWEALRPKPEYFTQLDEIIRDLQSIDRREAVVARKLDEISTKFHVTMAEQVDFDGELSEVHAWLQQERESRESRNSRISEFAQAVEEYVGNVSLRTNP
jgi:hypothetical protein